MAGEGQLQRGREDANARMPARLRREDENSLGEVHLLGQLLHRRVVDLAAVGEDGQLVALERGVCEDVYDDVAEGRHSPLVQRLDRGVTVSD